ncbi:MAG: molecular chaperone TorD family protein [Chloroflexi bacterium]|nr:molecular chaperone TorD family protein [Chloroflexota bacterium]
MMTTQTVKPELARARAKLYGLLAKVYVEPPDLEFLGLLEEWVVLQMAARDSLQSLPEQIGRGLTELDHFFGNRTGANGWEGSLNDTPFNNASLQEAISIEFTRLFRGVSPHYSPLPPYESVYLDEENQAFGELSVGVQREYRRFGLDLTSKLPGEPPDHLSFELEFLHILCTREAEAWENSDEVKAHTFLLAERQFLRTHLVNWVPKLGEKIREFDRLGIFAGIADITEGWLAFDYEENLQGVELPLE